MKTLYNDKHICLEIDDNNTYRVTKFGNDHHWCGEIVFDKERIINDDLSEEPVCELMRTPKHGRG